MLLTFSCLWPLDSGGAWFNSGWFGNTGSSIRGSNGRSIGSSCLPGIDLATITESVYLTMRTTAMVCWLFVGSYTFSSVFSYLGEQIISEFVEHLDLSPVTFLLLAQLIIFLLGWPLEWSEIIIIFVPIFLPLLPQFGIDPIFFGILVALKFQTSSHTTDGDVGYYLKDCAATGQIDRDF